MWKIIWIQKLRLSEFSRRLPDLPVGCLLQQCAKAEWGCENGRRQMTNVIAGVSKYAHIACHRGGNFLRRSHCLIV